MLSGANIIFMTFFSWVILGRPILRHYYLACALSLVGFVVVGYSPSVASNQSESNPTASSDINLQSYVIGIVMVGGYLLCSSIQGNVQELILRRKAIHVQRMIGLEGMFGMLWSFLLIMGASYVACPRSDICDVGSPLEDPVSAVYQILNQKSLLFFCCTAIIAVLVLNLVALQLVKLVSAVYKAFWATLSIIIVWVDFADPGGQHSPRLRTLHSEESLGTADRILLPDPGKLHLQRDSGLQMLGFRQRYPGGQARQDQEGV